jgi:hypothetical protein
MKAGGSSFREPNDTDCVGEEVPSILTDGVKAKICSSSQVTLCGEENGGDGEGFGKEVLSASAADQDGDNTFAGRGDFNDEKKYTEELLGSSPSPAHQEASSRKRKRID